MLARYIGRMRSPWYYWQFRLLAGTNLKGCLTIPLMLLIGIVGIASWSLIAGQVSWKQKQGQLWRDGGFSVRADLKEFAGVNGWFSKAPERVLLSSMPTRSNAGKLRMKTRHYGVLPAKLASRVDAKFTWTSIPYRKLASYDIDVINASCTSVATWFYSNRGQNPLERALITSQDGMVEGEVIRGKKDSGYCFEVSRPKP